MAEKMLSLIIPVYYEEEVLAESYRRMDAAMQATGHPYEIIYVNDGSRDGTMKQLRLFIDRCSIEAFDAEGKMAMTNLVFPSEPYNMIKVKGGKTTIYEVKSE